VGEHPSYLSDEEFAENSDYVETGDKPKKQVSTRECIEQEFD